MLIDNDMVSTEDKALTRSGLVMSGANHILEDEELPDNVEDGILTAKEISDVDLRGLDLVVLSACQTGLGDISQGEGVFGLQRGFKKAGANSILMSLWEVDDKATQILMTQFYKNLLSGQSKRLALLSAQKHLREIEGGKYDKPRYWAAFILLDGLDKSQMN
jgi:CHAT domain-containing protein